MKARKLRAIVNRYGVVGVLIVGTYMVLHYGWHRRRPLLFLVCANLSLLILWLLTRPAPTPLRTAVISSRLTPVAPEIQRPLAKPPLQDDTAPGPPLPKPDSADAQASNGTLFFAAQYFRMSGEYYQDEYWGKDETLAEEGPSHLYRIRPDGSGRRQLTWGRNDDYNPHLSPDGKYLLFVRFGPERHVSICSIGVYGGSVRSLPC